MNSGKKTEQLQLLASNADSGCGNHFGKASFPSLPEFLMIFSFQRVAF